MAQSKHDIQAILAQAQSRPRHRFGQNFMIDQNLVRLVAQAGQPAPGELVIEVGPGTGTLTEELLASGADILAVEIDRDLAAFLREKFADNERFKLIEGDALAGKHELNAELLSAIHSATAHSQPVKLVANLPYNIAAPLAIELLLAGVELLAFVVQKEMADRLKGKEGTDDYGPLSVMAQLLADVEVVRKLPPAAFWPAPKVDSALVRMVRRDRLGEQADAFHDFVQKIFTARRKTLRKALDQAGFAVDEVLTKTQIDGQRRGEELSPETLFELFKVAENK